MLKSKQTVVGMILYPAANVVTNHSHHHCTMESTNNCEAAVTSKNKKIVSISVISNKKIVSISVLSNKKIVSIYVSSNKIVSISVP